MVGRLRSVTASTAFGPALEDCLLRRLGPPGSDQPGAAQVLKMLRRIGGRNPRPIRQHLDAALTLGKLLQGDAEGRPP